MARKILAITGTRSDYGLMRPVYQAICADPKLSLHLIVTGMHFLPQYAHSLSEIYNDNYGVRYELPISDPISTPSTMAITLAEHIKGYIPLIEQCAPDIILLQGDRGEMLAAAIAGSHLNIPLIHMSGGDFSGSIDDSIRHAITKFSHFHLPTCAQSYQALLSMGEEEIRIRTVGEPALNFLKTFTPITRKELIDRYHIDLSEPSLLVAQHSVTTEYEDSASQITETLEAILSLNIQALVTAPNSDAGGSAMMDVIMSYVERNPKKLFFHAHLGQKDFFSMMNHTSALIGNSSAGILESASFKIPVVNIGTRQHGRMRANNVIDVGYDRREISNAIQKCLNDSVFLSTLQDAVNPYGNGDAAEMTVDVLKRINLDSRVVTKWIKGYKPV